MQFIAFQNAAAAIGRADWYDRGLVSAGRHSTLNFARFMKSQPLKGLEGLVVEPGRPCAAIR